MLICLSKDGSRVDGICLLLLVMLAGDSIVLSTAVNMVSMREDPREGDNAVHRGDEGICQDRRWLGDLNVVSPWWGLVADYSCQP